VREDNFCTTKRDWEGEEQTPKRYTTWLFWEREREWLWDRHDPVV